jgi:hypothetical protein
MTSRGRLLKHLWCASHPEEYRVLTAAPKNDRTQTRAKSRRKKNECRSSDIEEELSAKRETEMKEKSWAANEIKRLLIQLAIFINATDSAKGDSHARLNL